MVRTLVESLKRLYEKEKLSKEQIFERVQKKSISAEEYEYITSEVYLNDFA